MVVPPPRDVPGDLYADAHFIPYEDGRMTCDGVVWQYRIYHPSASVNGPPTRQFGTIGDIAYVLNGHSIDDGDNHNHGSHGSDTRVWYRGAQDWIVADPTLGAHDIPNQKHPLLKGKYRLDGRTRRWRVTTTYYYLGAMEKQKKKMKSLGKEKMKKERQGDVDVDDPREAVKVEPSESRFSAHEQWNHGSRQTGWIDLSNTPESEHIPSASGYFFSAPPKRPKLVPIPSSISQPLDSEGPPHSASSTSATLHVPPGDERSTFLHEFEGMNFQYPTLGFGLGLGLAGGTIVPPPRSIREFGVQTDEVEVSEVNVGCQDPFGGMTFGVVPLTPTSPMAMLVHHHSDKITQPPSAPKTAVASSSSSSSLSTSSNTHTQFHDNQEDSSDGKVHWQNRVESLLERILLESANDRKDIVGLIRTMNERLEAIERRQTQPSEGLPPPSPSPPVPQPASVVGASREINVPTTTTVTPTMTEAAVPTPTTPASGYVRPSLPLPKRYLKECRARKPGEPDAVGGTGTVNAGPNMTMGMGMTKRKVSDEPGGIANVDDAQEGVVKKSRFSERS